MVISAGEGNRRGLLLFQIIHCILWLWLYCWKVLSKVKSFFLFSPARLFLLILFVFQMYLFIWWPSEDRAIDLSHLHSLGACVRLCRLLPSKSLFIDLTFDIWHDSGHYSARPLTAPHTTTNEVEESGSHFHHLYCTAVSMDGCIEHNRTIIRRTSDPENV